MSSPNDGEKAGHAPAVKAGGMRIVQHKKDGDKTEVPPMTAEEQEEFGSGSPPKDKSAQGQVVSGAVTKGDKDFTPQAVKSYHEKPMPHHDNRPRAPQVSPHINQPR